MSDIQELIHKTSMDCIEKGKSMERERVLAILSHEIWHHTGINENGIAEHRAGCMACKQMELINGQTNG